MSPLPEPPKTQLKTYLILAASRGIGLEFARQLLEQGHRVVATARKATGSSQLWALTGTRNGRNLSILECDVADEGSVGRFVEGLKKLAAGMLGAGGTLGAGMGLGLGEGGNAIDVCVVNAGVLVYPNRVMEM
jgi:NAD(P)-dependent dehydrogenase (short-subunit alcohol dehydrogenase family)